MKVTTRRIATAAASPTGRRPALRPRALARREQLLRAAAEAFMERGYAATSIDDVAALVDSTKGRVYHHYATKSALYFDVITASLERQDAAVRAAFAAPGPPAEKLERMSIEHVRTVIGHFPEAKVGVQGLEKSLLRAEGVIAIRALRRIVQLRDAYEDMFKKVVAEGIRRGQFHRGSVSVLAKAALGALNWVTIWYDPKRRTSPEKIDAIAHELAGVVVRGLRK